MHHARPSPDANLRKSLIAIPFQHASLFPLSTHSDKSTHTLHHNPPSGEKLGVGGLCGQWVVIAAERVAERVESCANALEGKLEERRVRRTERLLLGACKRLWSAEFGSGMRLEEGVGEIRFQVIA